MFLRARPTSRRSRVRAGMVPLTRLLLTLARPTPRQDERAPQPAQSTDENYSYARVQSEVGLQARQRGEAAMWRHILVF